MLSRRRLVSEIRTSSTRVKRQRIDIAESLTRRRRHIDDYDRI